MSFFVRRLRAMEREGQVMINRKGAVCVVDKLDLKTGRIIGHKDGFGFIKPDDGSADLFVGEREMHKVLHGDRVMFRQVGTDRRGRPEGSIIEVIERVNQSVVARLYCERGVWFAVCGIPKDEARRFILQHEHQSRKYYSGFVGPISPKGKTHLYVSLRCMNILDDGSCELYAGGGLLKESEMEKEWKETEAKMQTILSVL
jgi:exoribonuclease R